MKRIREYIGDDMFNHILMSGGEIRACVNGSKYSAPEEKLGYCQGILTVFPHMLLMNFSRWLWSGDLPKPYEGFMDSSVGALQKTVFPVLEQALAANTPPQESGKLLALLITDVVPKHVLNGYYDYMFVGSPDGKDISEFWTEVQPFLKWAEQVITSAYQNGPLPTELMEELYLFVGTRMPFILIKRWYDWQFGAEKLEMPPPPQD